MIRLVTRSMLKIIEFSKLKKFEIKAFELLLEMFKFFKNHPPENLSDKLPSLSELDYLFRSLRTFSDEVINYQYEKSNDFFEFMKGKHSSEVFVKYVGRLIVKIKQTKMAQGYMTKQPDELLINFNDLLNGVGDNKGY